MYTHTMKFELATDKTPAGDPSTKAKPSYEAGPSTKGSYFAFVRGESQYDIVYCV